MTEESDGDNLSTKSKQLIRSHALCGDDDTKLNVRQIEKQCSSKSSGASSLSRDSSNELYTDSTGINLEEFIIGTLHKNRRDRDMLLQLEEDLTDFFTDPNRTYHRFPAMSSYNRMLVHRVAAFFGLDHNVDQSGTAVVVTKSKSSRLPDTKFKDYIKHDFYTEEVKRVLKRDVRSYEEARVDPTVDIRKARSFDEREEHYERTRARIFTQDSSSSAEGVVESPIRPWSSTESSSEGGQQQISYIRQHQPLRNEMMQKAYSYGGSPIYYRTDAPQKINVRGYADNATMQQHVPLMDFQQGQYYNPVQPVIFAVGNLAQVPVGAIILHPVTGQPYLNADGSIYRHEISAAAGTASPTAGPVAQFAGGNASVHVPAPVPVYAGQTATAVPPPPDVHSLTAHFQHMSTATGGVGDNISNINTATGAAAPVYVNQPWTALPKFYSCVMPQQQQQSGDAPEISTNPSLPPASQSVLYPNSLCMQPTPVQYQPPASSSFQPTCSQEQPEKAATHTPSSGSSVTTPTARKC